MRKRVGVFLAGALLIVTLAPPAGAHTAQGIKTEVVRLYRYDTVPPGSILTGLLYVTNEGDATRTIRCKLKTPIDIERVTAKNVAPGETEDVGWSMTVPYKKFAPPIVKHCHVVD